MCCPLKCAERPKLTSATRHRSSIAPHVIQQCIDFVRCCNAVHARGRMKCDLSPRALLSTTILYATEFQLLDHVC
jgi:hypothetical protein